MKDKNSGIIYYGFGREYLSNWGVKEALREVYQNFIDYGEYSEDIFEYEDHVTVTLRNEWRPENLEFLRVGKSEKRNKNSIGKHGEGLKMAFLILEREDYAINVKTHLHIASPVFIKDNAIGEVFAIEYSDNEYGDLFEIEFDIPANLFKEFKDNLIEKSDVVHTHPEYGHIVDKEKGNIYSGGLFVANLNNLSRAYDINPEHLELDRDRSVPRSFDVNWASSKILSHYDKWNTEDLSYTDTLYVDNVPEKVKQNITPVIVGNEIEFTVKNKEGKQEVLSNDYVKQALHRDNFFSATIKKLKLLIVKKLGLYEMLVEFQNKHVHGDYARRDFNLILERVGQEQGIKEDILPF